VTRSDQGLYVVGDVHGCLRTFERLLLYWNSETETLVQVGDLIDRGAHSPETVRHALDLIAEYGDRAVFLRGNHEYEFARHFDSRPKYDWYGHCGRETLRQYAALGRDPVPDSRWLDARPMTFGNTAVLVSHAGFARGTRTPHDPTDDHGLLWNRGLLEKLPRLQVIGHTPDLRGEPRFRLEENAWNVDTGACYGGRLTGLHVSADGLDCEPVSIPVDARDLG